MTLKNFTVGLMLLVLTGTACQRSLSSASADVVENAQGQSWGENAQGKLRQSHILRVSVDPIDPCASARDITGTDERCDFLNDCAKKAPFHDPERAHAMLRLVRSSYGTCGHTKATIIRDSFPQLQDSFEMLVWYQGILGAVVYRMNEVSDDVTALEKDLAHAILMHLQGEDAAGRTEKLRQTAGAFGSGSSPRFVQAYLDKYGYPRTFQETLFLLQILYPKEASSESAHRIAHALLPTSIDLADSHLELELLDTVVPNAMEDPAGYSYAEFRRAISFRIQYQ